MPVCKIRNLDLYFTLYAKFNSKRTIGLNLKIMKLLKETQEKIL